MLVTALKGLKVVDVACGSGDAQTLAVTENGIKKKEESFLAWNHQHHPKSCSSVFTHLLCVLP